MLILINQYIITYVLIKKNTNQLVYRFRLFFDNGYILKFGIAT